MKVLCSADCRNKTGDGCCGLEEIAMAKNGVCGYVKAPEFEPFCDDIVAVYDKAGIPSIMRRFRRMTDKELFGGPDKPHPMFVIGGEVYDEIYISVYPNAIINGKAYSLPMQQPAVNVPIEEAEAACFSKGEGWHLWTAMERGFLANLCLKGGALPYGNTGCGGSGHTVPGAADPCGNIFEWCRGLRLKDGRLQAAKDNDAAMGIGLTKEGDGWQALMDEDGEAIRVSVLHAGDIAITSIGETPYTEYGHNGCKWEDVAITCDAGIMKELALFPGEPEAYLQANSTAGEYLAACGGCWGNGDPASVFSLNLEYLRSDTISNLGFRSAYYQPKRVSP